MQSLDHLRVALCARRDPWGRDRHCVLITSACGSEGKTTLAAQLAERCVNAGLMTLLIDADLRNPTLSRMLDAAESPGLINVLRGEMLAEDVVTVVGDAGGFHLLPAGTPRVDPSRLLQGDRLGKLIAQARESFDMIIVDAPPVLPVPDALTIGRWTDGAVLAVRYDTSRFPLVERANRRLAHVGVPVIGAVVNGVRSMESTYGGYYGYGYGRSVYGNAPTDDRSRSDRRSVAGSTVRAVSAGQPAGSRPARRRGLSDRGAASMMNPRSADRRPRATHGHGVARPRPIGPGVVARVTAARISGPSAGMTAVATLQAKAPEPPPADRGRRPAVDAGPERRAGRGGRRRGARSWRTRRASGSWSTSGTATRTTPTGSSSSRSRR